MALVCVEVPSVDSVVTVTSTRPVPGGGVAVIDVALIGVKLAAAPAKDTALVVNPDPLKSVPWIVTAGAPPDAGPALGDTHVTVGAACCTTRKSLEDVAEVPPGVVTSVSYWPDAIDAGRLIVRSELSMKKKQSGWPPLGHGVVNCTVGPPLKVGTRSTSVTALMVGVTGSPKPVPVTAMPVAPSGCGLATRATVGGARGRGW